MHDMIIVNVMNPWKADSTGQKTKNKTYFVCVVVLKTIVTSFETNPEQEQVVSSPMNIKNKAKMISTNLYQLKKFFACKRDAHIILVGSNLPVLSYT